MRSKSSLVLAFVLGALAVTLLSFAPQMSGSRWEYTLASAPGWSFQQKQAARDQARQASLKILNDHGNQGWELVEVLSSGDGYTGIFRRAK